MLNFKESSPSQQFEKDSHGFYERLRPSEREFLTDF